MQQKRKQKNLEWSIKEPLRLATIKTWKSMDVPYQTTQGGFKSLYFTAGEQTRLISYIIQAQWVGSWEKKILMYRRRMCWSWPFLDNNQFQSSTVILYLAKPESSMFRVYWCCYLKKNSIDYFKCVQHTGQSPVTHHTTPSHRDWVTIDYKHTLQSLHSTLGRSTETYPTTLSHRDWDLLVHTYWSTGWDMNPWPWGLKPRARPLRQWYIGATISICHKGHVSSDTSRLGHIYLSRIWLQPFNKKKSLVLCERQCLWWW